MSDALRSKRVLVIGGSSGIGRAVAEAAAAAGAEVVVLGRSGAAPAGTTGVAADVLDRGRLAEAIEEAGPLDHLVYTAGARSPSPRLERLDDDAVRLGFETKLFGAIAAVRLALPRLAPDASVTLTSGQVSRKYGAGSLLKGSANAAVEASARHLAKELAPRRVNAVSPGVVDTDLWGEAGSEARTALVARVSGALPVGRVGAPAELAAAYLFAMTNGFVTGTVIDVDGGGLL